MLPNMLQGLILETPEVVPFRLTQNLVDGFGASGYEGVFRKSCEITLQASILVVQSHTSALTWEVCILACQPGPLPGRDIYRRCN
jgi:hypothetical protein